MRVVLISLPRPQGAARLGVDAVLFAPAGQLGADEIADEGLLLAAVAVDIHG